MRFSQKRQDGYAQTFFQGLGENTWSLQPALKRTTPAFKPHRSSSIN